MKIRHTVAAEKVTLQMTPMIDIVFQLLVFFIMTFKIVAQEGDFNVKMPLTAPTENIAEIDPFAPMKLRLKADGNGDLASIQLGDRSFANFQQLRDEIIGLVGGQQPGAPREEAEIELDCDYDLRYENVIAAITAVTGYQTAEGNVVRLIEKIKFAAPRAPGEL